MLASYDRADNALEVSPYLLMQPKLLRDVCRRLRHDEGGRFCARCPVREFCERQFVRMS